AYGSTDLSCPAVVVLRQTRRLRPSRLMDVAREQVGDVRPRDADIGKRTIIEGAELVISRLATAPALISSLQMLQAGKNKIEHFQLLKEHRRVSVLRCTIGKPFCRILKGARFEPSHTPTAYPAVCCAFCPYLRGGRRRDLGSRPVSR